MKLTPPKFALWVTGLGLTLSLVAGCQTWEGGMTLPSGRYLEHTPQYFPQEPDFPLPRELSYQEEKAGLPVVGVGGVVGVAPPVGGVQPVPPPPIANPPGR